MKNLTICIIIIFSSFRIYGIEDLTDKTWSEAFEFVHSKVKDYYPFIEHKKINLDSLYTVTSLAIKKAEKESNDTAFFIAIRNYAFALNDNHVFAKRKGFNIYSEQLSGHFGFEILSLDNGDVVVSQIKTGATNLAPEIKTGTKIISWNNTPIKKAIRNTPFLKGERMEATAQNRFLTQCEELMYAPLGSNANIKIETVNGGTKTIPIIALPIEELKSPVTYPKQTIWRKVMESPVDFNIFDDESIGYFQISSFMPNLNDFTLPSTFQEKLWILERFKVESLIIDLRGNQGGIDTWANKIAGHFVNQPKHYQFVSKFNETSGRFEIDSSLTIIVEPKKPYFDEEVLILVDNRTISTGEGLPMVLKDLPNVHIVGQYTTAGAFATGFSKFIFKLPQEIVFGFLEGRSLDKNGNIQVDADYRGIGGVIPDIKVPVSLESIQSQYVENKDYLLDYAVNYLTKTK